MYEGTVTLVSGYTGGLLLRTSADGTLGYEIGLSTVDNQLSGVVIRGGQYTYQGVAHFDDLAAWALP